MDGKLKKELLEELGRLEGKTGLYYKNLVTGEELAWHDGDCFNPASTIKLAIMAEVYRQASLGRTDLQEKIRVLESDKVPGCGALRSFDEELDVSIATLCRLMITISDNTATNVLIRHFGEEKLTEGFRTFGLEKTTVRRRFYDLEKEAAGINNQIVPREMGNLLEQLYRKTFVSREVSEAILQVLLEQQITHKLEMLPGEVEAAHKTGEQTGVTNEIALIYGEEPFVFCFFSEEADIHPCNDFIRRATARLAAEKAGW